jgi:hypothetical protein
MKTLSRETENRRQISSPTLGELFQNGLQPPNRLESSNQHIINLSSLQLLKTRFSSMEKTPGVGFSPEVCKETISQNMGKCRLKQWKEIIKT